MPHVFASQIEYVSKHLKYRDNVVLSLHPHNDRGCGVGDCRAWCIWQEQTVLKALYSETVSVPVMWTIVTVAMNMYSHGVDPKLRFLTICQEITETL